MSERAGGGNERVGRRSRTISRARSKPSGPRGFAERRFFGRYLRRHPRRGGGVGPGRAGRARRCAATPEADGWRIELDDGGTVDGAGAGAGESATSRRNRWASRQALGERFINNPWNEEAKAAVARGRGERRRRAAGRHRADDDRRGAVARCRRPPGPDRRAVAARANPQGACGF